MTEPSEADLRRLYAEAKTIAVVGCSPISRWPKPSAVVPAYMQAHGYRILPVNPYETEILGEPAVPALADLQEPVDIVDVFRPADETPAIAQAAVDLGARYLWLQTGIVSEEARSVAEAGGLVVVMDQCIAITYADLGLGPAVPEWKAAQQEEAASCEVPARAQE
jgi:predicted CoA-binding protein